MPEKEKKTHPDIVKLPERVLRQKTKDIAVSEITSAKIKQVTAHMKRVLSETPDGVGLAAPQVGEPLRLFIVSEEAEDIDRREKMNKPRTEEDKKVKLVWKYYVFINPILKKSSRTKLDGPEGCLSVPGRYGMVKRHEKVTVEAYDEAGKKFTRGFTRFFARVIQHELDHLEGTIFIDKAHKFLKPENDIKKH